jgi:hypothetical protein
MKKIEILETNNLVDFCKSYNKDAKDLITKVRYTFGSIGYYASFLLFPIGDFFARRWLEKTSNPYLEEIDAIAESMLLNGTGITSGIHALNLSYEGGCSTGGFQEKGHENPLMLRILDWPSPGMGEHIFVLKQSTEAGEFYNITWPGVSGTFQALAPGRFAAAINMAPMKCHGLSLIGDWIKNRFIFYKTNALPPAHLLRQVFEQAKNYEEAKKILSDAPVSSPVIFTLTGVKEGEACVIERLENESRVREIGKGKQVSVTNHFQSDFSGRDKGWRPRPIESDKRSCQVKEIKLSDLIKDNNFSNLPYPIISKYTRLCLVADAKDGTLMVQGWEKFGPVTEVTRINSKLTNKNSN